MGISRSNYDGMDWIDALKARKEPIDYEKQLANSEESTENVLERTLAAAFSLPTTEETPTEALYRASNEIQAKRANSNVVTAANAIRTKLADREIDPVGLGVVALTKGDGEITMSEKWASSTDLEWLEKTAKDAAVAFQKKMARAWEDNSKESTVSSTKWEGDNPEAWSRMGRIMSTASANEDTEARQSRVPLNANSIFDPFKLDRFAEEDNAHDMSVQAGKMSDAARKSDVAKARAEAIQALPPEQMMNPGRITSSGNAVQEGGFGNRVASNQVSMMDDLKEGLKDLFLSKIEDPRTATAASQAERLEKIQGKKEKADRSWASEEKQKPTSTANITERLMNLWMPEEPSK